jgi:hypothetical protein
MPYHGHKNYWEDDRREGAPIAKDAEGQTIIPTQQMLDEQLARLRRIQQAHDRLAQEQLAQKRWDIR